MKTEKTTRRRWRSPLTKGMMVTCFTGLSVETLEDPRWQGDHYLIKVRVLDGGDSTYSRGELEEFRHEALNRFKISKFRKFEKIPPTLEDEYFERVLA